MASTPLDLDTGLFLVELGALEIGLAGGLLLVGSDGLGVLDEAGVHPLFDVGVLRADDHIGAAEQRVGAGGVDGQRIAGGGGEVDLGTMAAADPVALLGLDALDVVHVVQVIDQTIGIGRDLEHPLALDLLDHGAAAALADAVDHFLVGQHDLAAGAVVDGGLLLVGKAFLVELQEDPLGPLVVFGVGGIDLPVPVKGQAQGLQLALEPGNVFSP